MILTMNYYIISILMILIGLLFYKKPEVVWKIKHYIDTKGGEPTDFFISRTKITGVFAIVVGIIILIVKLFV